MCWIPPPPADLTVAAAFNQAPAINNLLDPGMKITAAGSAQFPHNSTLMVRLLDLLESHGDLTILFNLMSLMVMAVC